MVSLAWGMLRQRPASVVATFVALWFAVVVVTACGVMLESGIRFHGAVQRYAAAPVLVAATDVRVTEGSGDDTDVESYPLAERGHLPASLVASVAAAPGVRAAVADVAVPANVTVPSRSGAAPTAVEIHPWSSAALAPFTIRAGGPPGTDGDVVLDRGLAAGIGAQPGDQVRLATASGPATFTVSGLAAPTGQEPVARTAFVTDGEAALLSGGAVEVIGVLGEPGVTPKALASAVSSVVPAVPDRPHGSYARVFTGAGRGSVESPAVDNGREFTIAVSSVFGGCALMIAVLVIAGSVGLSVKQRQRDIALLRAVAATPRQVRGMVVRESLLVGLVAAAAGIWPGLAGAGWLRGQFVAREMVPGSLRIHVSWLPPLVAVASALLIAGVAAWIASLRPSRIRPTAALAETAVERGGLGAVRSVLGVIALAGGVTLCIVSAHASGDGAAGISVGTVFTLVVAIALLSPLLIRAAAATVGQLLRLRGVTGELAAANTAASARRLSAVLSSLVLAVALGGSLWFVQTSTEHAAAAQSGAGLRADAVVSGPGLTPDVAAALRSAPGVRAATGVVHSTVFSPSGGISDFTAQGVDPQDLAQTMDLGVESGSLADLSGATAAVDSLTAGSLHLHVGSQFHGWFGDGAPASVRIVAIYQRGLGFASFTLPRPLLASHTAAGTDDQILVRAAPGVPDLEWAVQRELARLAPGSVVQPRAGYQVALSEDLVQNGWTNRVVTGVLLVYVVIASVNALVMYALGRRREFAILRLSGTTRSQIRGMVRLEQVLLLGLALAVGAGIAAATLLPMVKGITGAAHPYIPPVGWAVVIGSIVVLGTVATVLPTRRALGMRPVEAIGVRE